MFGGRLNPRIAVIGAGIAGLAACRELAGHGRVTVFEKSRGVGGRMSSRRVEPWQFDHGTQFFTARKPEFRALLSPLLDSGLVREWTGSVVYLEAAERPRKRLWFEPHYVACPGMNALCKTLATDLDVRTGVEVAPLGARGPDGWELLSSAGESLGHFDLVLSTAPSPQTLLLLENHLPIDAELRSVRYRACFALMVGFAEPWRATWIAGKARDNPIEWIAAQPTRPGREMPAALVAHASADWSDANVDRDLAQVQQELSAATGALTGLDMNRSTHMALHRWRYALVDAETAATEPFIDMSAGLAATGDWCAASRIEDAWLAGRHLAKALLAR